VTPSALNSLRVAPCILSLLLSHELVLLFSSYSFLSWLDLFTIKSQAEHSQVPREKLSKKRFRSTENDRKRFFGFPPGRRLVQAWRRKDFPEGVYSMAAITLAPTTGGGTELILTHRGVPKHLLDQIEDYWRLGYWAPMKERRGD
jgi:hypothetical protein